MFSGMVRVASSGLPWLAVMAASVSLGYGLDVAVTRGVSTTVRAEESVASAIAETASQPVTNEACITSHRWMVYIGLNSWIADPSRALLCSVEFTPDE